jgi:protoporphyrinogen oxidase
MLPASDYGGRTVVYLSRYFTLDEPLASADAKATADDWVDALEKHFAPFDRAHLLKVSPFKTMYAAPLVTLGYKAKIPSMKTHIDGLTISTTAQIYPQDRGMSEAVRTGLLAADVVASS